jgi:P27 family predicted phage terminase small subunit
MVRGRKPIAAEIKQATGAYRKDPQRENKSAPIADGKPPKMPTWFGKHEKSKWKELVADLTRLGIVATDTREILVAYCTAYGAWMECREQVKKHGLAIEGLDKEGNTTITRNSFVVEMHKFRDQMNKLLPEFGLTPASRQKLSSLKLEEDKDDPFASIMERMGRG